MNKQLLRLKQRSNGDIIQVAQSDDSNNLYVNVAAGTINEVNNVSDVDSVNTVDLVTEVANISDVDSVNLVDRITLVDKVDESHTYGENFSGTQRTLRVSNTGYLLAKEVQSALQYSETKVYGPWPDGAAQYTGFEYVFPIPTDHDIAQKYIVYVANPSPDTSLTMSVRNEVSMFGGTVYGQIHPSGSSSTITVPAATYNAFSGTAWTSCFTSIGGVLSDESRDLNDTVPPASDVPFTFGAINDAIYFGATGPFQRIRINIGTAGVYTASGAWEYWNGSAWTSVGTVYDDSNATVTDGTQPFKRTGSRYIQWQVPADWTAYDITGDPTSQYWIRWRVTNFTSMTTGPALTSGTYKRVGAANVHGYLFEGLWNGGDCKITLENATALTGLSGFPAEVYIKRL